MSALLTVHLATVMAQVNTTEENPARSTLQWIILGLLVLAVVCLVFTVWFWRRTSPKRR
jgi:membrane protein DedA with SNARE-associated domain